MISVHRAAFALILVGAAMIPAPARAGEAVGEAAVQPAAPSPGDTGVVSTMHLLFAQQLVGEKVDNPDDY